MSRPETASQLCHQAQRFAHSGYYADAERHFRRAIELAEQQNDMFTLTTALISSAVALIKLNRPHEAVAMYERRLALSRYHNEDNLERRCSTEILAHLKAELATGETKMTSAPGLMPFVRPNLLVLRCSDLERARRFYESLSLSFAPHTHGQGPQHYAHESPYFVLELYPAQPGYTDQTALGFATDNLDALHALATKQSLNPTPIQSNPWGRSFILRDPDNRRVEITQA